MIENQNMVTVMLNRTRNIPTTIGAVEVQGLSPRISQNKVKQHSDAWIAENKQFVANRNLSHVRNGH